MNILVTGGTGFIGTPLCRELARAGHRVAVLTRDTSTARARLGPGIEVIRWDPANEDLLAGALAGVDGVVNLAGESIGDGRWTAVRKRRIIASRVGTTRALS